MSRPRANDSGWSAEIIALQEKLFQKQFGREPGADDPLFLEPSFAVPQFPSDEFVHGRLRYSIKTC
jgi:hypothetical protein